MLNRRRFFFSSLVALLGLAAGCVKENQPSVAPAPPPDPAEFVESDPWAGRKAKVGLLLERKESTPYFKALIDGAREAAAELGEVDLVLGAPADGSHEGQEVVLKKWLRGGGFDAFVVSPIDHVRLATTLEEAMAAGVKVVTFDNEGLVGARHFGIDQTPAETVGTTLVGAVARHLGGAAASGEIAVVTPKVTGNQLRAWYKKVEQGLSGHPGIKVVAIVPADESAAAAFVVTKDLVGSYPELKAVIILSPVNLAGIAQALNQIGTGRPIALAGVGVKARLAPALEAGTVVALVGWINPDISYLALHVANAAARGLLNEGDTEIGAGRLGRVAIEGESVLLKPAELITR